MRYPSLIYLLFLLLILTNCSPEAISPNEPAEPTPQELVQQVYFTFKVDDSIASDENQDDWILLHDNKGELLDFRPFEKGEQLFFEKRSDSIPDNFSVTLLKVQFLASDPCSGDAWHNIETFPEIEKGSVWNFSGNKIPDNELPEEIGKFKLTVTDIPGTDGFRLLKSNFVSFANYELSYDGSAAPDYTNNSLRLNLDEISLFQNTRYLISVMDENLELKHKFFESPMIGGEVNLSYNDFAPYDSYIYLPEFPPNLGNKFRLLGQNRGINKSNDRGYLLQQFKNRNSNDALPMGFLEEFDYYKTQFSISFENFNYVYNLGGRKPEILIPNEPLLSISNAGFSNFEMTIDVDYVRKVNSWQKSSGEGTCSYTVWSIHSNKDNYPDNISLPKAVTDLYELLKIDELELSTSFFYLQADSYQSFLTNKFELSATADTLEEYAEEYIQILH